MAESMQGMRRTHRCTEVTEQNIGEIVTVMGWVQKRRNLGSLIFIDLRDRTGLLQLIFDENDIGTEGFAKAGTLRSEFVIGATGRVAVSYTHLAGSSSTGRTDASNSSLV